jgi:hypothetical protein
VLIVRLTRKADQTTAQTLEPEQLAELWRDPFLRFSRALDGLFHDGVIVCEGDTDSQFYSAVAALGPGESRSAKARHVMFTYAGSKSRIPLITKALGALGVPVRSIVDFDALNDRGVLSALVQGHGHSYGPEFEADRSLIDAHLRGSEPKVKGGPLLEALRGIVGEDPDREIDRALTQEIRKALEPETGWRAAKKSGKAVVPAGEATVALERLLDRLARVGIFVVPGGAVESFVRAVGGKGPRWAVEVVEGGHLQTAGEARTFVGQVLDSLDAPPVSEEATREGADQAAFP